mmetsp:Transcript_13894/g.29996  ORF Transcript_13894/g.29996 Transcript_13894/m.29996 type:complete len:564 (-) Transcript_13894:480-2171(-)
MGTRHISGDEYRRQKELDEARKAGLAPAALDEDGKEINPHIPDYMTNAPWYLNKDQPTLTHQRNWKEKSQDGPQWYDRGVKVFQATKYRKGACENCGSMTHKLKDCLERPRQKGAKWTNKNIAADEKVEDINLASWDAKRDRWNGFDSKDYAKVVDRYEQLEAIRKEVKQKEQVQKVYEGGEEDDLRVKDDEAAGKEDGDIDDDVKITEEEAAGFGEVKKRVRTTAGGSTGSVRNLRIREDTAKYLLNLDVNSAHYDPKSRSMREDPNPDKPMNEKIFVGDNFVRRGGDYSAWQSLQLHSMEAFDKGQDIHMQANPSLAEMLYKQYKEKKDNMQKKAATEIEDKYGNAAGQAPEDLSALVGTERYVEYDRMGHVVKGQEVKAKSRYEEDVYVNNHTCVWGSWWRDGTWGYACCHQSVKNSYCTGKAGEAAAADTAAQMLANMEAKAAQNAEELEQRRRESKLNDYKGYVADVWGTETAEPEAIDPQKVKEALKKLDDEEKKAMASDGNRRKFNSLDANSENVTAEEMEAFRMKRQRADDPLAKAMEGDGHAAGNGSNGGYDYL